MEQRSICLINDSFPPVTDGVANAVVNYAKNLTQDGKRATVVTPAYPDADDTQFGFPVVRYPSVDLTKLVGYHAGLPFSSQTLEKLVELMHTSPMRRLSGDVRDACARPARQDSCAAGVHVSHKV